MNIIAAEKKIHLYAHSKILEHVCSKSPCCRQRIVGCRSTTAGVWLGDDKSCAEQIKASAQTRKFRIHTIL